MDDTFRSKLIRILNLNRIAEADVATAVSDLDNAAKRQDLSHKENVLWIGEPELLPIQGDTQHSLENITSVTFYVTV